MRQTIHQRSFDEPRTAAAKPVFKILIAYEDRAAYAQLAKVQGQLRALYRKGVALSGTLWNFALLRDENLRKSAGAEAIEANLIVVSLSGMNEMPVEVRSWMEGWRMRKKPGETALVTLLDSERQDEERQDAQIAYFLKIAQKCGLDFFYNVSKPVPECCEDESSTAINLISHPAFWSRRRANN
jgi:hypothetical protein